MLPEALIGSMSQNPHKRDSSFVQLSVSRLQQCTSPAFQDGKGFTLHLDELLLPTSLDAIMSYFEEHDAFPKEWLDLQVFLEKVFLPQLFSFFVDVILFSFQMIVILFFSCPVQHQSDKARAFGGVKDAKAGVDLMIMDIPEGLPVPTVSSPASSVPEWNKLPDRYVETVFEFASGLVHDNGVLLLFHPDDLRMRADIRGCLKPYHFSLFKEFMGVNHLPLTNARNASNVAPLASASCLIHSSQWRKPHRSL